ncbi:hypothetical protein NliqN6_3402 [Naganishia liquefaciens]|uniref:F-box domain-containing protein n=1 Tax=Naganishia liquefaciens TaxID=104408 RepID=A0A8H3TUL7_9TREE|nr:hypothetical protein NliqN6_3402 [Naganishia liquefaciens]
MVSPDAALKENDLPLDIDIWTEVLDQLDAPDISRLSRSSKKAAALVNALGWPSLAQRYRMHHVTVDLSDEETPKMSVLKHNFHVAKSLHERRMLAKQVGQNWDKGYIPKIRISKERILVAAGPKLIGYSLQPHRYPHEEIARRIVTAETTVWTPQIDSLQHRSIHQNAYTDLRRRNSHMNGRRTTAYSPLEDITGFCELPDGQVVTGNVGGVLQRQRFSLDAQTSGETQLAQSTALYPSPSMQQIVEVSGALSGTSSLVLSATKDGRASLLRAEAPWIQPSIIDTHTRLWTAHLSIASQPYAAFGGSGGSSQALQIYPVTPTGILVPEKVQTPFLGSKHARSAVYGLATPPKDMSMPYSNNPSSVLLSAWYDSHARLYDLRVSEMASRRPVMEMQDPWSHEALYCCDFTGNGHIVAGAARHGMLHIWDPRLIRSPERSSATRSANVRQDIQPDAVFASHRGGWTVYTPGQPNSPVYDVKAEGGRIWGVTNKRTFVLSFDTQGAAADAVDAKRWDIVSENMTPRHTVHTDQRTGGRSSAKGSEEARDYATCYEHGDPLLRPFYSLGADRDRGGTQSRRAMSNWS